MLGGVGTCFGEPLVGYPGVGYPNELLGKGRLSLIDGLVGGREG